MGGAGAERGVKKQSKEGIIGEMTGALMIEEMKGGGIMTGEMTGGIMMCELYDHSMEASTKNLKHHEERPGVGSTLPPMVGGSNILQLACGHWPGLLNGIRDSALDRHFTCYN